MSEQHSTGSRLLDRSGQIVNLGLKLSIITAVAMGGMYLWSGDKSGFSKVSQQAIETPQPGFAKVSQQGHPGQGFSSLQGIPTEALSEQEKEDVQGERRRGQRGLSYIPLGGWRR